MKPILLKELVKNIEGREGFVSLPTREADDRINRDCSEILERYKSGEVKLYRGDYSFGDAEFGIIDPRNSIRPSRNTNNLTTALIAQSEAWRKEGIPMRHKSVIMSCGRDYASGYGTLYEVYPMDGAKMAWGDAQDHWDCYSNGITEIFGTNSLLNVDGVNYLLSQCVKGLLNKHISSDASEVLQLLSEMDDVVESEGVNAAAESIDYHRGAKENFKKIVEFGGFLKMAQTYIDPRLNGIEAHRINGTIYPPEGHETWTDYPCYFRRAEGY